MLVQVPISFRPDSMPPEVHIAMSLMGKVQPGVVRLYVSFSFVPFSVFLKGSPCHQKGS